MNPNRAPPVSRGRYERFAIRRDSNPLFLDWSKGDLFRGAIRKLLTPQVRLASNSCAKVHPLSVRRPGSGSASAVWTYLSSRRASINRHQPAGLGECVRLIHLDNENGLEIR